jgi:hypothetical protein
MPFRSFFSSLAFSAFQDRSLADTEWDRIGCSTRLVTMIAHTITSHNCKIAVNVDLNDKAKPKGHRRAIFRAHERPEARFANPVKVQRFPLRER